MRQYLIDARNNLGLTQSEAAKLLYVSQNYLSNLETGKRQKSLNVATLKAFAKAYEMPLNELLLAEDNYCAHTNS